jgi:hypothetical protein
MSELTRCNYCDWQDMKRRGYKKATAEQRREVWDKKGEPYTGAGVVIVDRAGKFAAWFMSLSDHCVC